MAFLCISFKDTILYYRVYSGNPGVLSSMFLPLCLCQCLNDDKCGECTSYGTGSIKLVSAICTVVPGEMGSCCAKNEIK